MRHPLWLIAAIVLLGLLAWLQPGRAPLPESTPAPAPGLTATQGVAPAWLPAEAHDVLQRIARGGPFAYRQDGGVFHNRERRLPAQPRGYYREYTVPTPGARDRGARRLVTGGDPPREAWYTADHYRSFRRVPLTATGARR